MKTIIAVGGWSRSGKSSSLNILSSLGFPVVSTSRLLDKLIENLHTIFNVPIPIDIEERRKHKILAAEELIVPTFGREAFAYTAAKEVFQDSCPVVIIETIGGEEWSMIQKAISTLHHENYQIFRFNLRRSTELIGVDKRILLHHAHDIHNNGSLDDLREQWVNHLVKIGALI